KPDARLRDGAQGTQATPRPRARGARPGLVRGGGHHRRAIRPLALPAAVIGPLVAATMALLAGQQAHPLRKSDLIRLLSGSTFSQEEIAGMVRRTCLSFAPSGRDRAD